jgi:4-alpha-glucanotransferase
VQYAAFGQFKAAKKYAASKGVLLKGDLPILISRDSADVWAHPEFFKLDFSAGAPPDMYCAKGQRWGMPTYDWDAIASDNDYRYLKEKLKFAENFYDILRVDHVVGLFRIWSIPQNDPPENEGLHGAFDPSDEDVWGGHGRRLLSKMSENTGMLLCAEDLGMIPKACPTTLREFGIPGNEVQRWVKDWEKRHDFLPPEEYRQISVSMLSTHDTTNWAAWWENEAGTVDEALFARKCRERGIDFGYVREHLFDISRSRHGRLRWQDIVSSKEACIGILGKREEELRDFIDMYLNTYHEKEKLWKQLGLKGAMRERSDAEIVSAALGITLASRSVFCIELIIDYLYTADMFKGDPYQYRMNKPGTVAKTNWSLAMPVPLEDLLKHKVCANIKKLIADSGRA